MKTMRPFVVVRCGVLALVLHLAGAPLFAKTESERHEEQRHGYIFEKWVRDTFFEGYEGEYTQEWDVAKSANRKYGEIPVSIKTTKYGSSVDLGDALRQYSINEEFLIIIGYWQQDGEKKRIVNIVAAKVEPVLYRKLWEPIALEDLQRLDAVVKSRVLTPQQAREQARKIESAPPFTNAIMGVNPKIDAHSQRRVQCSLSFSEVFKYLAPGADPRPQQSPQLFGIAAPEPFISAPRHTSEKEN